MCVMGLIQPGQEFTPEHIEQVYIRGNNDGFGMGYVEGERYENGPKKGRLVRPGRIKVVKSMGAVGEVKKLYQAQLDLGLPFVFHLRNATAGDKVLENCHPYQVLNIDEGDPIDLVMFHNGTMRNAWLDKAKSDSRNFAELHLRGLLRDRPSMLYEEGFRFFLAGMIEGNKLIFLDNRERVSIINHDLGGYHSTGAWLSTKDDIKPYVAYKTPENQMRNFQLGAGQGTTGTAKNTYSVQDSSREKITWLHPDGKWVMLTDGRSHFIPTIVNNKTRDTQTIPLALPADRVEDEEFIKDLIAKAAPPKTPADFEKLKDELEKMDQFEMHQYVQEFVVEAAYMLKYGAGMWPETLPEFTETSIEDNIKFCIETPWNAAHGLVWMTRQKIKEKAHEVN